jgi:hypothetical protein
MPITLERLDSLLTALETTLDTYKDLQREVTAISNRATGGQISDEMGMSLIRGILMKYPELIPSVEITARTQRIIFNANLKQSLKSRDRARLRRKGVPPQVSNVVRHPRRGQSVIDIQTHKVEAQEDLRETMRRIDAEDDAQMDSIAEWGTGSVEDDETENEWGALQSDWDRMTPEEQRDWKIARRRSRDDLIARGITPEYTLPDD